MMKSWIKIHMEIGFFKECDPRPRRVELIVNLISRLGYELDYSYKKKK
jgi:hypothetical protein